MSPRRDVASVKSLILALVLALLWPACSDDGTTTPSDTTPPAAVTNLSVQGTATTSVTLQWTAPGDDGATGRATSYALRYAPGEPSAFVWAQATAVTGLPAPLAAGGSESFTVTGLTTNSTYSFALLTADEQPNWSSMSNVVSATPGGGAANCQVDPAALAFGSVTVGTSAERSFTITNAGTTPLSGTVAESCDPFTIVSGGGAYTLNGGEARSVTVRYAPAAAGNHACTISAGASGCSDVSCTGTGVSAPSGEMILIPAGSFTMGSDTDEGGTYEEPEHHPNLSAYSIDTYEVSNAVYAEALNWARSHGLVDVVDWSQPYGVVQLTAAGQEVVLYMDEGSDEQNQCRITWDGTSFGVEPGWEDHPVVYVTWWGAAAYCNWRSGREGKPLGYDLADWDCDFDAGGYRLPTEAEWEKAARGASDERTHPWGEGIDCGRCNYSPGDACVGGTAPVDDPAYDDGASAYGVHQMGGNVWEWCNDWYEDDYYLNSPASDPRGPSSATGYRCSRGGSWWNDEFHARCANRGWDDPANHFDRLGFRTALSTQQTAGCQVQPTLISFPETSVGSTVERTFTITNSGSGTLAGSVSEGCEHFSLVSGGGSYSLGAGQSHTVTVRYAPTAAGAHSCTIETGTSACSDVSCTGTATGGAAECSVDPSALVFPETAVGSTSELTFTIRNSGTGGAVSGSVTESCAHFSLVVGGGAYSLAAGEERIVTVRYEPAQAGSHECTVDAGAGCAPVACSGTTPHEPPMCLVDPGGLTFGETSVGATQDQDFTISNIGGGTLTGNVAESCSHFSVVAGGGAFSLAAGQAKTVTVRYEPTSAGSHECTVDVGAAECADVACSGTAVEEPGQCRLEPSSLSFGTVPVGTNVDLDFTIFNDGAGTLSGSVGESCEHFSIQSGGGSFSVAPGGSRSVTVRYAPSAEGAHSCDVDLGSSCDALPCTGTGGSAPEEDMVLIPAGSFTMGSDEDEGTPNERPEHQVTVSAFYMDRYEVTNAQYAEALNWARAQGLVMVDNPDPIGIVYLAGGGLEPCLFMDDGSGGDNECRITWDGTSFSAEAGWEEHPVVYVTWWGSAAYCNWRSGMAGRALCYDPSTWSCNFSASGYRLPTEAEWEKAARGGSDERAFPWGDEALTCELANWAAEPAPCVGFTARVDDPEYADGVSPYGVWQLSGNVWEWCNDGFDDLYYASSPADDPTGPSTTEYRVSRGGSWWDGEYWVRCAVRGSDDPLDHFDRLGLRAVRR